METQGKILRVLVEQKFLRLGGSQKVSVDVRIISSTSRDLDQDIREGRFREDLYHRLNVVTLRVPSLAERREDIPELIQFFIGQVAQTSGLAPRRIGEDAIAVLQAHDWPGNVRELRNNVERLLILAGGEPNAAITADMLPEEIGSNVPLPVNGGAEHLMSLPLREAREIFEREYLLAQINRFGGNISRTAEFVGMERSALHRKLGRSAFLPNSAPAICGLLPRDTANDTHRLRQRRLQALCEAAIHVEDRGFQFADAVYEVIEVLGGRLVDATRHLARLGRSLRELAISPPMREKALLHIIGEVIRRNRVRDGIVYMQVTRGAGPREFALPGPDVLPTLVVFARAQTA